MQVKTDIPMRTVGTETHSQGTLGVPSLDPGGTPETWADVPDTADLVLDNQLQSWGFWVGASGDVAMTARGRASSGVATGRRGTRPGYRSGRRDGRVQ